MNVYKSKSKKAGNEKLWLARQTFRGCWIYWHGNAETRADATKQAKAHFERNIADKVYDKYYRADSPWLKDKADWTKEDVALIDELLAE